MPSVKSSHIAHIDHDGRALIVRFRNGAVYSYRDVPRFVYQDMLTTAHRGGSVGEFLNQSILPFYEGRKHKKTEG
jgi:hypothetical protein